MEDPIQGLAQGTDRQALEAHGEIALPGVPLGCHLNAAGDERVAEFLRDGAH